MIFMTTWKTNRQDDAVDNDVLVGECLKEVSSENRKGVKPSYRNVSKRSSKIADEVDDIPLVWSSPSAMKSPGNLL